MFFEEVLTPNRPGKPGGDWVPHFLLKSGIYGRLVPCQTKCHVEIRRRAANSQLSDAIWAEGQLTWDQIALECHSSDRRSTAVPGQAP